MNIKIPWGGSLLLKVTGDIVEGWSRGCVQWLCQVQSPAVRNCIPSCRWSFLFGVVTVVSRAWSCSTLTYLYTLSSRWSGTILSANWMRTCLCQPFLRGYRLLLPVFPCGSVRCRQIACRGWGRVCGNWMLFQLCIPSVHRTDILGVRHEITFAIEIVSWRIVMRRKLLRIVYFHRTRVLSVELTRRGWGWQQIERWAEIPHLVFTVVKVSMVFVARWWWVISFPLIQEVVRSLALSKESSAGGLMHVSA